MPLTPKNRKEQWLEGLIQHETTLTPKNRPEEWMKEIIDASGGGGGTGGGVLVVHSVYDETLDTEVLDKTWQEINDAPFAVILSDFMGIAIMRRLVIETTNQNNVYAVMSISAMASEIAFSTFTATSADGYPVFQDN